jgi:ribosomal protein S18 acetylase RimI-like enzyme
LFWWRYWFIERIFADGWFREMSPLTLLLMQRRDIPAAAHLLSTCMLHNALHIAVFGGQGESARRAIEQMFVDLFAELPGISFLARSSGQLVGVMRMTSCHGRKLTPASAGQDGTDPVLARKQRWHALWAQHDPEEPHWHLGPIGVATDCQGAGIGSRLMERFCEEVDACRAPAYLETDRPVNVRFYQRFGFEVAGQESIFGVTNYFMWRPAN